jgi:hypothetical protein
VLKDGVSTQGLLLAPAPQAGFVKAFLPKGGSIMPPGYVEKSTAVFGGIRFSLPVMWQEFMAAMQRDHPESYTMFQQQLKAAPYDVENVIKALGDRWFVYVPSSGTGEKIGDLQIAVCVDLQDSAAVTTAWQQMLSQMQGEGVKTLDFSGVTIYQLGGPSDFDVEQRPASSPCFAILSDKFVFASSLDLAKSIINNGKREVSPLTSETEFQKLLGHTIESPDGLLFVDGRVLAPWVRARLEDLRHMLQMAEAQGGGAGRFGGPKAGDIAELPPADVLRKYESLGLLTVKWTDDGLVIKAWAPNPQLQP